MTSAKPYFAITAMLLALMLLPACATVNVGQDFDLAAFERNVKRNVSTQLDVRGWLGAPTGSGTIINADGKRLEKWTYYHGKGKLPKLKNVQLKFLEIEFDSNGKVVSYNWTE